MGIIVPSSIIIPIILSLFRFRRLTRVLKIACLYLYTSGLANLIAWSLAQHNKPNTQVMNLYIAASFVILTLFYWQLFNSKKVRLMLGVSIGLFFLYYFLNANFIQKHNVLYSNAITIESLIIVALSILYFARSLDKTKLQLHENNEIIYINSGLIIYYSASFLLFIISYTLINMQNLFVYALNLHATFLLIMYQLFAVALWKFKK